MQFFFQGTEIIFGKMIKRNFLDERHLKFAEKKKNIWKVDFPSTQKLISSYLSFLCFNSFILTTRLFTPSLYIRHVAFEFKPSTENKETGVQYPVWAKYLTPIFALINHFQRMITPVTIDCWAKFWLKLTLLIFDLKLFHSISNTFRC